MYKTASIDLTKTFTTFKSTEPIKMLSFEMGLPRIMDKCISLLDQALKPKDNTPEELNKTAQAKISVLTVQNVLFESRVEALIDATLKEIFFVALTKFSPTGLGQAYKILSKLNQDTAEFDLIELRLLLSSVQKIRSTGEPSDELNLFAKMFAIGELQQAILSINPNENFDETQEKINERS